MYKLGADFLKQVGSIRKDFFVTVQINLNEIDVLYFDELERKFDSDWAFIIGFKSTNTGKSWSSDHGLQNLNPTGSPAFDFLGEYKYKAIDVYGLARRGNEWRRLRLDYNSLVSDKKSLNI